LSTPSNRVMVFTDLVDSTRMGEQLGDARAAELWAEHDRRARALFAQLGGREIDRTDGFFILFDAVADAAAFARDYHAAIAPLGLAARVSVNVAPAIVRENSPTDIARGAKPIEVEGIGKVHSARVMSLARGGQTLLTRSARDSLGEAIPAGTALRSHGHYRLKGIEEPVEVFELSLESASFEPPADAPKAYRVVRDGELWKPLRDIPNNLPAERDVFVGRASELRALADRLDGGGRLVTVLGPGGTGKTRLARRYAATWLGDWAGGVFFCDLSEARSLDAIHFAVGAALEVPLGRGDAGAQLGHAIAGRGRCLVILDNFEQVVAHAADTVGAWLDRAHDAAFVVTSRERLHVHGEEVLPVEPMPIGADAIELFATRARAQRPDFAVTAANRADVAEVVRMLDGLPLAIELAAARIRLMSPSQLVARMRDRFTILAGARGVAARQATLRAAIDWSWDLLAPWEQDAFAQCAVFDGGFTLEAAEAVLDLSRWREAPPAMDVVQALCDKSLLRTWVPVASARYDIEEPFFGMYLTIREYASEKLGAAGDEARRDAETRHGAYFAGFGTDEELDALFLHDGVRRRRALALELDNVVAACRRAVLRGDGAVAAAALRVVCFVIEITGPYSLGTELAAVVLALPMLDDPARAQALAASAMPLRRAGRTEESASAWESALRLYRALGNRRCEAFCLLTLGNVRRDQGRLEEAFALQQSALALARETGYRRVEGHAWGNLGIVLAQQGRLPEARSHFEQALAIHREVGNRYIEGIDTSNLGNVCRESGRLDEARAHYLAALAIDQEVGNRRDEGIVMTNVGMLEVDRGRYEEARAHFAAGLRIAREVGDPFFEGNVLGLLAAALRSEGCVDDAIEHCERALSIHRAVGNRQQEGMVLGMLGDLLARRGRFAEARAALASGDALLEEIGAAPARVGLLCDWAGAEACAGENGAVREKLDRAAAVMQDAGVTADSEMGRRVAAARAALLR
jgi:predicted ATPase/tetratricopeptide (TPR) repeat protein/class 3 adenylate cyclase